LVYDDGGFAVGMNDGDRNVCGSIIVRRIRETHIVTTRFEPYLEAGVASPFVFVAVVSIAIADKRSGGRTRSPSAFKFRLAVVHHYAVELDGLHRVLRRRNV